MSPSMLRPLLDQAMPDAVFVHDHEGRFVDVNRRASESLGYTREELLTMNVVDVEQDFDLPAAQREWQRIEPHVCMTLLGHLRRKDGSVFPVEVHFGLLSAETDRLYVGVVRDISERERLAREVREATDRLVALERSERQLALIRLQAAETRYRGIIESMSEGMVLQDADGRITAANPAAERILGLTLDEMMGLTSVDPRWGAVHEDGTPFPGDQHPAMVALRSGQPQHDQIMGIDDPRTGRRWISINALPLILKDGDAADGVLATFVDITERKRLEAELALHRDQLEAQVLARSEALQVAKEAAETAARAKTAFLANMSHELHTPLNGIMGMNELALRRATDPRQIEHLNKLKASALRMLTTIDGVLDYAKLEADRLTLEPQAFPLQLVLSRVRRLHAPEAQARGLAFEMCLPAALGPLTVVGDEMRLGQILQNLVSNAVRFTQQGRVSVAVNEHSRTATTIQLRFEVVDTGIGIPAADIQRLFQPFGQLDDSRTRQAEGTGLGLAICHRLAKLMGGNLEVQSELGAGSRFTLSVPLRLADAPAA